MGGHAAPIAQTLAAFAHLDPGHTTHPQQSKDREAGRAPWECLGASLEVVPITLLVFPWLKLSPTATSDHNSRLET